MTQTQKTQKRSNVRQTARMLQTLARMTACRADDVRRGALTLADATSWLVLATRVATYWPEHATRSSHVAARQKLAEATHRLALSVEARLHSHAEAVRSTGCDMLHSKDTTLYRMQNCVQNAVDVP